MGLIYNGFMAKVIHRVKKHLSAFKKDVLRQMLTLATGAFGLIAALAWNELIKEIVNEYIKPYVGGASGLISLSIYAVLITLLAVLVTYTLTRIIDKD